MSTVLGNPGAREEEEVLDCQDSTPEDVEGETRKHYSPTENEARKSFCTSFSWAQVAWLETQQRPGETLEMTVWRLLFG